MAQMKALPRIRALYVNSRMKLIHIKSSDHCLGREGIGRKMINFALHHIPYLHAQTRKNTQNTHKNLKHKQLVVHDLQVIDHLHHHRDHTGAQACAKQVGAHLLQTRIPILALNLTYYEWHHGITMGFMIR